MTTQKAPTERILRQLFWLLLVRGRTASHAGQRQKKGLGIGLTCLGYGALGIFPAVSVLRLPVPVWASLLHAFTMMFAALTLAASAGSMLFAREEAEILLHRPIPAAHLLRAKAWVLVRFAMILALSLNAVSLVVGMFVTALDWRWLPVHLATTTLLMVFSTAAIVLTYNLCLRWFGRERLDNLLAIVQTLMTIVLVLGSQLAPQLMQDEALAGIEALDGVLLLLPPVWFGALDAALCGAMPLSDVWLAATIAIAATAVLCWLAFSLLAGSYGKGLASLGEGADRKRESGRGRLLSRLVAAAPLRHWLADSLQRHAFVLTSAYLARDRETKVKMFPSLVPLLVLPLVLAIRPGRGTGGFDMSSFALGYLAIVPLQPLVLLRLSEQYRTAELYQYTPVRHWAPLFHGCRKAVMFWLVLPSWLILTGVLCALTGSPRPFATGIPILLAMPVYSLVPALGGAWLPLSQPNQEARDSSLGCLTMAVVIGSGFVLSTIATVVFHLGPFWFSLYVAATAGASIYVYHTMAEGIDNRPWQQPGRWAGRRPRG